MPRKRHLLLSVWTLIGVLLLCLVFMADQNIYSQKTIGSIVIFYTISSAVISVIVCRMKKKEKKQ